MVKNIKKSLSSFKRKERTVQTFKTLKFYSFFIKEETNKAVLVWITFFLSSTICLLQETQTALKSSLTT